MSSSAPRAAMRATYRLQLTPQFGFADVERVAPYLRQLGISHLYLSPCLEATRGSAHGYDVVDPQKLRSDFGGEPAFASLVRCARSLSLGLVVDIVPNHMAADLERNAWWRSVLKFGRQSPFASFFEIDWDLARAKLRLPILGEPLGKAVAQGDVQLSLKEDLALEVYAQRLPLSPTSWRPLLLPLRSGFPALLPALDRICFLTHLARDDDRLSAQDADVIEHAEEDLLNLIATDGSVRQAVRSRLDEVNGSPRLLTGWVEHQHYELGYWRDTLPRLNYRRFFDIASLVRVRVERRDVFNATHQVIGDWLRKGDVVGLRVDHPDGLRVVDRYLEWLRELAPDAWIVVEKILSPGEDLPTDWPVDGTTGYDFLNVLAGLFIEPSNRALMESIHDDFTGIELDPSELVADKKRLVLTTLLTSEFKRLVEATCHLDCIREICTEEQRLERALAEILVRLDVYRTYRKPPQRASEQEQSVIHRAVESARRALSNEDALCTRLGQLLTEGGTPAAEARWILDFQQLSAPLMAKGLEDTSFYCDTRLVARNEVGGALERFGTSVEAFHEHCEGVQSRWPLSMSTTATHDTKRSEEVRLRISLLSEIPQEYRHFVHEYEALVKQLRQQHPIDRPTEYLLLQTLLGAWPISETRLTQYLVKAVREAKEHTSWLDVNEKYENTVCNFARRILTDAAVCQHVQRFTQRHAHVWQVHTLSQTLLKLTAPGIPDIYQGTELWDFSLTDPDNRRPVDWEQRGQLLQGTSPDAPSPQAPACKLWLTQRALKVRAEHAAAFGADSRYQRLEVHGLHREHVVAFARFSGAHDMEHAEDLVITVSPIRVAAVQSNWQDTRVKLPAGTYLDVFADARRASGQVSELLSVFSVALLVREG